MLVNWFWESVGKILISLEYIFKKITSLTDTNDNDIYQILTTFKKKLTTDGDELAVIRKWRSRVYVVHVTSHKHGNSRLIGRVSQSRREKHQKKKFKVGERSQKSSNWRRLLAFSQGEPE